MSEAEMRHQGRDKVESRLAEPAGRIAASTAPPSCWEIKPTMRLSRTPFDEEWFASLRATRAGTLSSLPTVGRT
jgi:hypothetical protein